MAKSGKALGKGLGALIPDMEEENVRESSTETGAADILVPIEIVKPWSDQPRKEFHQETLEELAESIKQKGVIQPIIVTKVGDEYQVLAGERRYRASKIAGLTEIPVLVRDYSDQEKLEIALIENLHREDLSPIEEAKAYKQIMESGALNQEQVADKVGKKRSTIANSLRLLKLPEEMQKSLDAGDLSAGHARSLLSVVNPADQKILFSRIVNDSLTVRDAEKQASELNRGLRPSSKELDKSIRKKNPEMQGMEQKFIEVLGTKVSLKGSLHKGKLEISYYSMEDLERIYEILLG